MPLSQRTGLSALPLRSARARVGFPLCLAIAGVLLAEPLAAEAVLDGSTGSTGSFSGDFTIPAAVGRQEGANLFHSFESFRVRNGESATFTGAGGIDNVISRVTGGAASRINGPLASTIAGADLFFLNPAGVVFGKNAALNLPGSFHASAAEELRLSDGTRFSAIDPGGSTFTAASPDAFGFLGSGKGILLDRGALTTAFNQTLSLSGRTVTIDAGGNGTVSGGSAGAITTIDGPLRIAAIRSGTFAPATGAVTGDPDGSFTLRNQGSLGALSLANGAIRIDAGSLIMKDSSNIQLLNLGMVDSAGAVDIAADEIQVMNQSGISTSTQSAGAGGPIRIVTSDLVLQAGSITTTTSAGGDGGRISITAERIDMSAGLGISASSDPGATGDGGDIDIDAGTIVVDRALIGVTRFGSGDAGTLSIDAGDVVLRGLGGGIQGVSITSGEGGSVVVVADTLTIDGAAILTNAVGTGKGGSIALDVGRLALVNGGTVSAATVATGEAGEITIVADSVQVTGTGSVITVNSIAETPDSGDGGRLRINAGTIDLSDGGSISSETSGGGDAGPVMITVEDALVLDDGAQIRASSSGAGRPGDVTLEVGSLAIGTGASIGSPSLATMSPGDAGSSTTRVMAEEGIRIEGTPDSPAGISSLTAGPRDAGTIRIDAPAVTLVANAFLSSSTLGDGDAGAVLVHVGELSLGPRTSVDSASPDLERPDLAGGGGEVRIVATDFVTLTGSRAGSASITTSTATRGDAGRLTVRAPLVRLDGGVITSGTQGAGDGGQVTIEAERIEITGPSTITTRSTATGAAAGMAGGIRLSATDALKLRDQSSVSAQTAAAEAGDIVITVGDLVELRSSSITTSVAGGQGGGGNIRIDPRFVVLDDSRIVANALEGAGGNITIVTDTFLTTPGSTVDASSELGIDGTVNITAPDLDLTSELAVLATSFVDVSGLLRESCAARAGDQTSSFATGGGRALSPDPATPLAGRYAPSPTPAAFHHWSLASSGACDG